MFFVICLFSQKEEGLQLELQQSEGMRLKVHLKVGNQSTDRAAVDEVHRIIIYVIFLYMFILYF
jgi:hypothetical protein